MDNMRILPEIDAVCSFFFVCRVFSVLSCKLILFIASRFWFRYHAFNNDFSHLFPSLCIINNKFGFLVVSNDMHDKKDSQRL